MEKNNIQTEFVKILIVDDIPENIHVAKEILEGENYKVIVATSGEKAIARTEKTNPDLILLDINMPGMDGFEVCQILKAQEHTKNIPIIFLSALADTQNIVKGFELGAVDYITKPFKAEEVLVRVKTQVEMMRLNYRLKKEVTNKNKFCAIMAHDLKNPFIALTGLSDIIMHDYETMPKEEIVELVGEIHKASSNTQKLLENLLEWSRAQVGSIKVSPENFLLRELVDQVLELLKPSTLLKKVELLSDVNPSVRVYADKDMIETVVRNLLTNAIKFTPEHGVVKISAVQKEDKVSIIIEDSGIGMEEELKKKLFDITENVKRDGTLGESGTGFGLIIVKEFICENWGDIQVESEVGKGSKFIFTLPNPK
ncbi:MAG: hybrid sensor histidine kinase/response regulator [Ignavibacteria bacterium]|jgi:signal transduction histidine kinase